MYAVGGCSAGEDAGDFVGPLNLMHHDLVGTVPSDKFSVFSRLNGQYVALRAKTTSRAIPLATPLTVLRFSVGNHS